MLKRVHRMRKKCIRDQHFETYKTNTNDSRDHDNENKKKLHEQIQNIAVAHSTPNAVHIL